MNTGEANRIVVVVSADFDMTLCNVFLIVKPKLSCAPDHIYHQRMVSLRPQNDKGGKMFAEALQKAARKNCIAS